MPGTKKQKAAKMPKLPKSKKPQSADARSRRMAARQPELSGAEYEGRLEAVSALQAGSYILISLVAGMAADFYVS